jgi:transaldolase / glucose-6-phosphate isomerase
MADLSGLELLVRRGGDASRIASVDSFFVSRIDTAVDRRLEQASDRQAASRWLGGHRQRKKCLCPLQGDFLRSALGSLEVAGARTQRLLLASTSTKNLAFRPTMYVEALIGRDTVDTMPPVTMDAFREPASDRRACLYMA